MWIKSLEARGLGDGVTDTQANRPKQRGQLRPKTWESSSLPSSHTHSAGKSCCLHLPNRPRICPLLTTSTATSLVPAELPASLSRILHQQGNSRSRIQTQAPWRLIHVPYRPPKPRPERPKSAAHLPSAQNEAPVSFRGEPKSSP